MHVVNINDAFLDRAMCARMVAPALEAMTKRGYQKSISDPVERIRADLALLDQELTKLCDSIQTPDPGSGLAGFTGPAE